MEDAPYSNEPLITRPAPRLTSEQVARFTRESVRARPVRRFDPHSASDLGTAGVSRGPGNALAIDIGGDKLVAGLYQLRDGRPEQLPGTIVRQQAGGFGYVDLLAALARTARKDRLPVGISFAGPTEGTRLVAAPNLPHFFHDLQDGYDLDFAGLFRSVVVTNDAEAGMVAAAVEAVARHPEAKHVIYIINGSGLGGAVLTGGMIYACEPGHVPVEVTLNPFAQGTPCGLLGATHVCLERVAASKAGVEDLWRQHRGTALTGREIAAQSLR